MEGKVCINNKINHVVSCINIETIAEPIDTIVNREHSVKHKILKFSQVGIGKEVCFVHDGIIADFGGIFNRYCATLPTGFFSLLKRHTVVDTYRCVVVSEANPMQFAP